MRLTVTSKILAAAALGVPSLAAPTVGMAHTVIIAGSRALAAPTSGSSSCPGLSVHDGDTIRCGRERVRLADIDAPELPGSPKCEDARRSYAWCDFGLGYQSRDALRALLSRGRIELIRQGHDRYGRTLAIVLVNGRSAGDYLIASGLAKPYR